MKKLAIFLLTLCVFWGCNKDEINQDPNVLEGTYRTNAFLDPLCIAITDDNQLPSLQITKKNDGTFNLLRTNYIPQKTTQQLEGVTSTATSDGFELYYQQTKIGTYKNDRWYDDKKDKEVTSKVLKVNFSDQSRSVFFAYFGVKK